ncbi:phage tail tube protein [Pseudomonas luteola]|uniref:Lambda phage tail tube protein N-terminal domain-containing protein n=1 Tax=Pseudomonas luteola TaxID=47886 RepID=A0ABS0MUZ3_PSELU|nr:phage tail tube protein [Pseudomonas luteola]MBH3440537.1 hypothetical protein [Pseudomonas luteola]
MPSGAFTSAGTTLAVAAALPATQDAAGYAALTWVLVGDVTDIGEFGKSYDLVTHNPLAERATYKRKGNYNNGNLAVQMARVPTDGGQTILIDAVDDDDSYPFRVVLQNGTTQYFSGQVMSYTTNVGNGGQITAAAVSIEIDGDVVEVAPAP